MSSNSKMRILFSKLFTGNTAPRKSRNRPIQSVEVVESRELLSASTVDTSFATSGILSLGVSPDKRVEISDVLLRPDGRVISVGSADYGNGDYDFVVYQHLATGAPDPSFGINGRRSIAFDRGGSNFDKAYKAALQPDGKLVIVGSVEVEAGHSYVGIVRLDVTGKLDTTFALDNSGKRTLLVDAANYQDIGKDVLIQADGSIVIVGDSKTSSTTTRMFIARLDTSGSVFAAPSTFLTGTVGSDLTFDATLQPDGKVLVAGYSYGTAFEGWIVRLKTQSSDQYSMYERDLTFSGDGRMQLQKSFVTDVGADFRSIALQADGKIVVAGTAARSSSNDPRNQMVVVRVNSDGTLDENFGVDGSRQIAFDSSVSGTSTVYNFATSVLVAPDGKIIAGGTFRKRDGNDDFAIARLLPNGDNDGNFYPTLGTGRRVYAIDRVSGSGGDDNVTAMVLGTNGKIYVAGVAKGSSGSFESLVMRLEGDPNVAPTDISLSSTSVGENLPEPAIVGTLTAADPDAGNTHVFELVGGAGSTDNSRFLIDDNVLATTEVFDFEVKTSYSVRVRATDQHGLFFEKVFTINVGNELDGTGGVDRFTLTYSATTVNISMATGTDSPVNQGTFPVSTTLFLENLQSTDLVRVVGTGGNDVIERFQTSLTVNGSGLVVTGSSQVTLAGGAGDDTYRFPNDGDSGGAVTTTLDESGGGIDTLDFSDTGEAVTVNLNTAVAQNINAKIALKLSSSSTIENIKGSRFNDRLTGNSLANTITGNGGNDTIIGGLGSDSLLGGAGDDTYIFSAATVGGEVDTITEVAGEGIDTLNFSSRTTGVTINIADSLNQQQVHTDRKLKLSSALGIEIVLGGSGNDTLRGNSIANVLVGNSGSDTLIGNNGRDILIGGEGQDTLNGGNDDDIVVAGRTISDALPVNLAKLLQGWNAGTTYATRVTALRAGVGSPKVSLVKKISVLNDSGSDDKLSGGSGTDWFFRATDDVISDLFAGESIDVL